MNNELKFISGALAGFLAGAVVGAVISDSICDVLSSNRDKASRQEIVSFEALIQNQLVVDKLDGAILAKWFREQDTQPGQLYMIAKVTENNALMLMLDKIPDNLDREHALLQAVIQKSEGSYSVDAVQLVSFAQMAEELRQYLGDHEYCFIKGE